VACDMDGSGVSDVALQQYQCSVSRSYYRLSSKQYKAILKSAGVSN